MPLVRKLNQNFFNKWSPEMAYVLGYFAADGSMIQNSRGAHFIEFTSTDRVLLAIVQKTTQSTHKITIRMRGGNAKPAYRLQIGSKDWFSDLRTLGFTEAKSKTLKFPTVPSILQADFIRGYFDGDGCVYFNNLKYADRERKRWILTTLFTSGSHDFLISLWRCLKTRGITGGSLKKKARGFELVFSHKDSLALYQFMYHTAQTSNLFLPRKRIKLERAVMALWPDEKCGHSSTG